MSLTPQLLKALFAQLVDAAGGVEASGHVLGVSHQRVSQLQVLGNDQLPSVLHIARLEAFVRQPVITGYLARLCQADGETADPVKEAVEVVGAAAEVIELVSRKAPAREIAAAVVRLKDEADDVTHAVGAAGES